MKTRIAFIVLVALACGRRPVEMPAETSTTAVQTQTAATTTFPIGDPLPESALKIEWAQPELPARISPRETVPLTITIKNLSNTTWPAANTAPVYKNGRFAVRLSYRWCAARGQECGVFESRFDLPKSVAPGESVDVPVRVLAPSTPGNHELQFDAVQELVMWFGNRGADRLIIPVHVG